MTIEDEIKERLSYADGRLYWKKSYFKSKIGKPTANTIDSQGYPCVKVCGKMMKVHRVAWLLHYGSFPDTWVDHKDGNKKNNNIENLRLVNGVQSNANRSKTSKSKLSSYKGVSKSRGKWKATIKDHYLGTFDTELDAARAYDLAAKSEWGEYSKTNERYEDDN